MTRCRANGQISRAELDLVAMVQIAVCAFGAARGRYRNPATCAAIQHPCAGHVIGVDVGVDCVKQMQSKLFDQRGIPAHLFEIPDRPARPLVLRYRQEDTCRLTIADRIAAGRSTRFRSAARFCERLGCCPRASPNCPTGSRIGRAPFRVRIRSAPGLALVAGLCTIRRSPSIKERLFRLRNVPQVRLHGFETLRIFLHRWHHWKRTLE